MWPTSSKVSCLRSKIEKFLHAEEKVSLTGVRLLWIIFRSIWLGCETWNTREVNWLTPLRLDAFGSSWAIFFSWLIYFSQLQPQKDLLGVRRCKNSKSNVHVTERQNNLLPGLTKSIKRYISEPWNFIIKAIQCAAFTVLYSLAYECVQSEVMKKWKECKAKRKIRMKRERKFCVMFLSEFGG
jgi:hypothetical protein